MWWISDNKAIHRIRLKDISGVISTMFYNIMMTNITKKPEEQK